MNKKATFYKYAKVYTYLLKQAARLWNPTMIPKGTVRYNQLLNNMTKIYDNAYDDAAKNGKPLEYARNNIEKEWKQLYHNMQPESNAAQTNYAKDMGGAYDVAVYDTARNIRDASKGNMSAKEIVRNILGYNTQTIRDRAKYWNQRKIVENGKRFLTHYLPEGQKYQQEYINNLGVNFDNSKHNDAEGNLYNPDTSEITINSNRGGNSIISMPALWHELIHGGTSVLHSKPMTEAINHKRVFNNGSDLALSSPINIDNKDISPKKLRYINETRSNFIPRQVVNNAKQDLNERDYQFLRRITNMETDYSQNSYNRLAGKPTQDNPVAPTPKQLRKFNNIIINQNRRNGININEALGVQSADRLANKKNDIQGRPNILQQVERFLEKDTPEYDWFMNNKEELNKQVGVAKSIKRHERSSKRKKLDRKTWEARRKAKGKTAGYYPAWLQYIYS